MDKKSIFYNVCSADNVLLDNEKKNIDISFQKEQQEWKEILKRFSVGNISRRRMIEVGQTPNIVVLANANPLPICMGYAALENAMANQSDTSKKRHSHGHNLKIEDMEHLLEYIRAPLLVFQENKPGTTSLTIITEGKNSDGKEIIVTLALDKKHNNMEINKITTIFPANNINEYIEDKLEKHTLIAINEKANELATSKGNSLEGQFISFDDNIPYIRNIVNLEKLKKMDVTQLQEIGVNKDIIVHVQVAIESTSDYQNPDEGFTYYVPGEVAGTKYRLVRIGEDGNLVPYPDEKLIFKEQQDINDYIATNNSTLEEMNYDDMVYLASARKAEVLEQKKEQIKNSMHSFEFEDGYLYFSIDVNGYSYDGLYRIYDPANGRSRELVSIDNGISEPFFKENWDLMSEYLHGYVKEHPQIGPDGEAVNREKPSIYCEWSEHSAFEEGKVYSITEFNQLMKAADKEWVEKHEEWEQRIQDEFGGEIPEGEVLDRMTPEELVGLMPYQKTKFTVYLPEYAPITERQDIGDGDGGVIDFFRKMGREKIAQELEVAITSELEGGRVDPKMLLEHHQETAELEHILQMVNDFSKLYGEANTPFSRDGFQHRLSEILTEYKKAIDSNPEGTIALIPTFFEDPNPNEIDIRRNRLWNEFWQALERYGITGDEKFSADINSIATDSNTQEKALSIMKEIQHYLDDRLYMQSYMKDGKVMNVDCVSNYRSMVSEEVIDAVFVRTDATWQGVNTEELIDIEDSHVINEIYDNSDVMSVKLLAKHSKPFKGQDVYIGEVNGNKEVLFHSYVFDSDMYSYNTAFSEEYFSGKVAINEYLSLDVNGQDFSSFVIDEEHLNHDPLVESLMISNLQVATFIHDEFGEPQVLSVYSMDEIDEAFTRLGKDNCKEIGFIWENSEFGELSYPVFNPEHREIINLDCRISQDDRLADLPEAQVIVRKIVSEYGKDYLKVYTTSNTLVSVKDYYKYQQTPAYKLYNEIKIEKQAGTIDMKSIIPRIKALNVDSHTFTVFVNDKNINIDFAELQDDGTYRSWIDTDTETKTDYYIEFSPHDIEEIVYDGELGEEVIAFYDYDELQSKQYVDFVNSHQDFIDNKEVSRIPVVINAFGGPGSGKSVSCMDICQQLKKLGYNAEYVQEYAKDLVYDENWDMLDGSPENQFEILKEQLRRVDRLYGTVDFIVTDSPVLLNSVYNKSLTPQYDNMVTSLYKDFENFTYFVERDTSSYQQEGRIQNLEESQKIDEEIKQLLAEKEVYYGTYNHDTINKIVSNSIKTFNRINHIDEKATAKQVAYAEKIATTLNIDLPEDITKEAYRYFISENQEKFLEISIQVTEDSERTMKYEDYLEKVSQNGNLLKDVPEEYHTEELLLAAVSNWGAAIRNVPADKLTPAIVLASVTQYGTNLRHVPKEMRSEEVCIAAYVNSAGKAIRYAPNEIKDAVKTKAQEILANNNTSISSSKRQVEVEQLQEQGQEWATQISNMLREHETDPEAMVEDIIFASKFYQYSVKNIQIMRRQNPGMTFVASASAFEQMGYHVKNGEKAMIARVPSFSKYVIDENGEYIYASKYTPEIKNKIKQGVLKEHEKLTRYVFRPAFYDISQTDCPVEDYPSMFYMGVPSEMHQEAFLAMKEFAEDSLGFKVMAVDLKSISLRGNCEPDNKIIRVNDKLESTLALSTLCHEIAHGIIHTLKESAKMTTAQKECEADVMAIMLESSLGLAISESRREHLYHAFHTYKDEQAAKEHPYEVTLEKLIDRVQKKVFRPYAEDIKYYLALHLPVDGVENDNVARNLVKDMALFDSAYQLHFNLSIDPEHELFAEDKIELYRTLYQQTKEEYRLGNSFVPKLAVIKDFGKDETFLTSVQFIDKETVDTIKNLSAHVTQEYLPLQIELGDVLAIKENVLEDSQLYIVTEQGLQLLSDKLNQELENKINCGFDVSTEYQCIRNLLQNNIEILSDTIPEYYNHICERFGYTKDVAQTTSNQFMARINLITEGMSSNDKELIAEYVFRTGNYQKAEKYAEKLQKEPGISKQLLQEMRLIDSYKYMLWTIADYEDTHSVSGEKRITTGAYNNASIPLLSENAHSLSRINECFLEIKKHNAQESVKYYSIVTEEEGYRIGYVELDDYVPSIKYSTGVYSSYEEAKEFYNLYLETANSHLVAAAQANHLVDLEKEANLIALSDVTAIGNTIADEKYRFKELGVTENDLLNLLRDKIDNYQDVNSIHTLDASVQILKDFKQTINDFGEKHFVELCNLDDFSDINVMEESLQVANWLSKQREVIANCGQNGIEDVTQLIDMAMDNCVTTADLEQAYNAIDAVVLNSEYSNLKAHFDGYEDYNSAFDTLKSSFVTADKFCYIDYKADDIPMLYTSDPAGNVYKKSLRNEWTGSVQEMYGKLQKTGYEVCSNFDDFKAYAMNNRLAVPGAPERKKEGVYVRVIESTSDLLTKGQTLSVYDFKNHMDKIYSGSSEANNCVTYKLVTRNNQEIQSYIDTYSGDVNMNVYEKLYDKAKEQSPELCKLIGKQYYQDVIDFSERHLMKPLLEQLKEQGKTEIDSAELQNLTSSCDKLKEVIKELDLSPAEAEILKLNVGSMQVGQVADIQRQMQLQQNQQLQKQRNKQNEGISLV